MVYINQVEFENFKSFGGNVTIPLEEGFTVVTGPNGSGKSNILDGILFCLGLASSRGMRAERLPDLINNSKVKEGKSSETSVSVKFNIENWQPRDNVKDLELDDKELYFDHNQKEWVVSRKLRLMPGGSYASTYTSDGRSCTLQQIQKLLRDIMVDPEGSNVVMQGDVTRIVSMSNKERRTLIDELAGVALFDSRIEQTHVKLNDVQERQERCEILQNELQTNKLKLEKECDKAKKYKKLKEDLFFLKELEKVVLYKDQIERLKKIEEKGDAFIKKSSDFDKEHQSIDKELFVMQDAMKIIAAELKDKGEDELIKVNSEIGSLNTNLRELDRLSLLNKNEGIKLKENKNNLEKSKKDIEIERNRCIEFDDEALSSLQQEIIKLTNTHKISREKLSRAADQSGEFSKQTIKINTEVEKLNQIIEPLNLKKRNLEEEIIENNIQRDEIENQIKFLNKEKENILDLDNKQTINIEDKKNKYNSVQLEIKELKIEIELLEKTKSRLSNERLQLEKDLSRFESRREALNESRGSYALRILLEAGLEGIHGYVAQLGEVKENYRYALEIAAGNRLGQIVVENDYVASRAIEILKKKKAGRLTFLPLNRIKKNLNNFSTQKYENISDSGFIDKAVNLIDFDSVYSDVFHYVFGETKVFNDLESAKKINLKSRVVTLSGELLEVSGAITGGSKIKRDLAYKFGSNNDKDEISPIKQRLMIINDALIRSNSDLNEKNILLEQLISKQRQINENLASTNKELDLHKHSINSVNEKIYKSTNRIKNLNEANQNLLNQLNIISSEHKPLQQKLDELSLSLKRHHEKNQKSSLTRINQDFAGVDLELQTLTNKRDALLQQKNEIALSQERLENNHKLLLIQEKNLENSIRELAKSHKDWTLKRDTFKKELLNLENQKIILEKDLGILRRKRDELNSKISNRRQDKNEISLKLEYLKRDLETLEEEKRRENIKLNEYKKNLPNPLPSFGALKDEKLEYFQSEIISINAKLESLEPVNMLALDELEDLNERLNALIERLAVLANERSELLLRIETVSTMRQDAFMEAFSEVDKHFREIFAMLSDGDGYLQLENTKLPLDGGLTLVAHPKGKNVRRLASMSGGEKSLTALSFLFALQKYKPSPFYALDEVDSFLDGVNVERLSKLIASQSSNAQFIVVSHRRPMISASTRTIGVAQARGAHTQVIGLPNAA